MPPEQEKTDDHDGASVLAEVHHDADHKFRALDSCHDCSAANHPRSNRLVGYLLYVATDPLVLTNRVRINTLALGARLPTMYGSREYVDVGGLMSYGPNYSDLFRRAADYVDKILRGSKPGDIPVEQPTKFDLVINLTTAQVLGLTVPSSLLARADEVIE